MQGSFYADTYVFNKGDGQDRIIEHGYNYYFSEVPLDEKDTADSNSTEAYDANNDQPYDESGDFSAEENEYLHEENSWIDVSNDKAIDKLIFGECINAEDLWFEQ